MNSTHSLREKLNPKPLLNKTVGLNWKGKLFLRAVEPAQKRVIPPHPSSTIAM